MMCFLLVIFLYWVQSVYFIPLLKGSRLAQTCEKLGAGEILLNCFDKDGTNSGFDIELVKHISESVSIPVIASSGAGKVEHFSEVFEKTDGEAVLAAGIFQGRRCPLRQSRIICGREVLRRGKAGLSSVTARTDKRTRETSRLIPLKGVLKRVPLRYKYRKYQCT